MNQTMWMGHEIDKHGIKPIEEKVEVISKLNSPKNKKNEIISRSIPIHGKTLTQTFGKNGPTPKTFEEK